MQAEAEFLDDEVARSDIEHCNVTVKLTLRGEFAGGAVALCNFCVIIIDRIEFESRYVD